MVDVFTWILPAIQASNQVALLLGNALEGIPDL